MKIISDFKQLVLVYRFDFLIFLESFADVDIAYDVAIQRIMGNLPFTNATLALKHPGISKMEKNKNIFVRNIEYPIRTLVHMFEQLECKGFLISMELKIPIKIVSKWRLFQEISTPFC